MVTPEREIPCKVRTDYTAIAELEDKCIRMDSEIIKLSTLDISKSKFTMHYKELKQDMIQTIKKHKKAINCQQFN